MNDAQKVFLMRAWAREIDSDPKRAVETANWLVHVEEEYGSHIVDEICQRFLPLPFAAMAFRGSGEILRTIADGGEDAYHEYLCSIVDGVVDNVETLRGSQSV